MNSKEFSLIIEGVVKEKIQVEAAKANLIKVEKTGELPI